MANFGWSYPPGCDGPPDGGDPHPEAEKAWEILEKAGVEESVIEQIADIIEKLGAEANRECQQCLAAHAKAVLEDEIERASRGE